MSWLVKTHGKKRWNHKSEQQDLFYGEILADSLHNSIIYYLRNEKSITKEKLEKWEINASKILGIFRSILGKHKQFQQLQLKRWINPAPNQVGG